MKKKITNKPIRRCYSLHDCYICKKQITFNEMYYDGGKTNRRAHVQCADNEERGK